MDTNLPLVLIRVPEARTDIEKGASYRFKSTMPNSRYLLKGAHVIVDKKIENRIQILGYGLINAANQIGLYRTPSRMGKYYEAKFAEWRPCERSLTVNAKMYSSILAQNEIPSLKQDIRPLTRSFYDVLKNIIEQPRLLDIAIRQSKEAQLDAGDIRYSLRKSDDEIAHGQAYGSIICKADEESLLVPIYYGTDRQIDNKASLDLDRVFTGERSDDLTYGIAEVSIPKSHQVGRLESPPFWKIWKRRDSSKYVLLAGIKWFDEEEYLKEVASRVKSSERKDAFVFIHGYNVSFEDAARRTAQIAYDLKFQGAPILYSWPSKGVTSAYLADEATIEWTVTHLTHFLEITARKTGAEIIHLIGHSMGNRALVHAMKNIDAQVLPFKPAFNQVMLTAPDIDSGVFKDLAEKIVLTSKRLTLYASSNDKALQISQDLHDYPRIGQTVPQITIVPGVDTIDASTVDTNLFGLGHSYAAESRSVLSDIYDLIHKGDPPDSRFNLMKQMSGDDVYWAFKP